MGKLFLILAVFLSSQISEAASFNCQGRLNLTEEKICQTESLSKLDDELSAKYLELIKISTETNQTTPYERTWSKDQITTEQRVWMNSRVQCGKNEECLIQKYETRISEIDEKTKTQKSAESKPREDNKINVDRSQSIPGKDESSNISTNTTQSPEKDEIITSAITPDSKSTATSENSSGTPLYVNSHEVEVITGHSKNTNEWFKNHWVAFFIILLSVVISCYYICRFLNEKNDAVVFVDYFDGIFTFSGMFFIILIYAFVYWLIRSDGSLKGDAFIPGLLICTGVFYALIAIKTVRNNLPSGINVFLVLISKFFFLTAVPVLIFVAIAIFALTRGEKKRYEDENDAEYLVRQVHERRNEIHGNVAAGAILGAGATGVFYASRTLSRFENIENNIPVQLLNWFKDIGRNKSLIKKLRHPL